MTRIISQKFRFLTFVSIVLLAYVHGYNLQVKYLTPFTTIEEPLTFTTFFEYLMSNGLLRFRIPVLFLISGYLYAMYDTVPYTARIKRRFVSLVIPYLLWSAGALLLTYILQRFPFTANIVTEADIDQLHDTRPYEEIGWLGMLKRWLLLPTAYQLWFIMELFVCNLLYPFFRWVLQRYAAVWLTLTGILWFTYFNFGWIGGQGLFFFSFGVWLKLSNYNIEKMPRWFSLGIAWIFFAGACLVHTFMAFELEPRSLATYNTLSIVYNLATLSGIMAVWYSVDWLAKWCMNQNWFRRATAYAFFIYGGHVPLLPYLMTLSAMYLGHLKYYRLPAYIILPALVVLLCIGIGALLKRTLPAVYGWFTGGRGI